MRNLVALTSATNAERDSRSLQAFIDTRKVDIIVSFVVFILKFDLHISAADDINKGKEKCDVCGKLVLNVNKHKKMHLGKFSFF